MRSVSQITGRSRTGGVRSSRRGRRRAGLILLSGAVAIGAGVAVPGASPAFAAPKCNYVAKDSRPLLNEKSQGDAVAQAQCLIGTRSGFAKRLDVTGVFGPETTQALLWVQKCNQVKESGGTDEATWKVLYRAKKGCGKPRSPAKPPTAGKPAKPAKPAGTAKPQRADEVREASATEHERDPD